MPDSHPTTPASVPSAPPALAGRLSSQMRPTAWFTSRRTGGARVTAAVFTIPVESVTVDDLVANAPVLQQWARASVRHAYPRPLSMTYLLPHYVGPGFTAPVVAWVQTRHRYRWGISHQPLLYDTDTHAVWNRNNDDSHGLLFAPFIAEVTLECVRRVATRLGRDAPERVNGQTFNGGASRFHWTLTP